MEEEGIATVSLLKVSIELCSMQLKEGSLKKLILLR